MADKAFVCSITGVSGTSNAGEVTMNYQCCFARNDQSGETQMASLSTQILFTDSLAQIRDKIAATVEAAGTAAGFNLVGANTIIMPSFVKV